MSREMRHWTCALLALVVTSCGQKAPPPAPQYDPGPNYGYGPPAFKDEVTANVTLEPGTLDLAFVDADGKKVDLAAYRGKKNVVLVVTRGFSGVVCALCTAQTSRLISNHADFAKRDAEVLVVFPGPSQHLPKFVESVRAQAENKPVPFALLLDEDFKAVDRFGIRADLAKPATYILDKTGKVRFAYVGSSAADRPSVKAMLKELDAINVKK